MRPTFLLLLFFQQAIALSQSNFWQQTAGPYGGNVHAIGVHPSGRIFVATTSSSAAAGVYFSDNNGTSWTGTSITDWTYSIGVSPSGSVFASIDGGATYKSTDNGATWIQIGLPTFRLLTPISPVDLIAATAGGVYRSTNDGTTWTLAGLSGANVLSLTVDANGYLFAGTRATTPPPQPHEYGQVYRSTDNGANWSSVLTVPFNAILALTHNRVGQVFTGTNGAGIYRSTDNGVTWASANSGLTNAVAWAMASDSSQNMFVGTGGGGIFRSSNNGNNWNQVGLSGKNVLALTVAPTNTLLVGLYYGSGFYLSTDSGDSWTCRGMPNALVWSLATNASGHVFAGALGDNKGVYRSTDHGNHWTQANNGLPNSPYTYSLVTGSSGVVYAGLGGVFRSTNEGDVWVQTGLGSEQIFSLALTDQGTLFAGGDDSGHIFRSTDDGTNWTVVHSNPAARFVHGLALGSNGFVYAGVIDEGVLISSNNGENWRSTNIPDHTVECVCVNSSGHIFAGTYQTGVYRSTDDGTTWVQINNGLLGHNWVWTITINTLGHLFAGTIGGGAYQSTNGGENWTRLSGTFLSVGIRAFAFDPSGYLYIGAENGGVYRSSSSTTTDVIDLGSKPKGFSLEQNYPNPFNPKTTIHFSLLMKRQTLIKVFDLLGRELSTLIDGSTEAGTYSVEWDASSFASGVYLYRIQTDDWVETKKMLLLK